MDELTGIFKGRKSELLYLPPYYKVLGAVRMKL